MLDHPTTDLSPTDEQLDILSRAESTDDNIMMQAYAGTGKTSTLELIERSVNERPILYLVFNKKNAEEATQRMLSTTTVRTFNSLGHRIWASACSKRLTLNSKKIPDALRKIINDLPRAQQGPIWDSFWDIVNGVGRAKALGYVPEGKYPTAKRLITPAKFHASLEEEPDDLVCDLIDALLTASIREAYQGVIDYNDQIYMPALFGGNFPRFPLVLVDEYQDLNPVNLYMIEKLVGDRRLIGVGDTNQSIYAFRGANVHGMSDHEKKFSMTPMDLSISFRCPSAIVEHARWHVPKFRWFKEGGSVAALDRLDSTSISDDAAIICRNNAPLFSVALSLLASGRSVSVAGSDIGPKLIAMMKKLGDGGMSRATLLGEITAWEEEKLARNSTTAHDLAECMRTFARASTSLDTAIAYAEHLFAQRGRIQLMTGHKAKGLEFSSVYHLDPALVRGRFGPPSDQDKNLDYVITTRSRDQLYEIASGDIRW